MQAALCLCGGSWARPSIRRQTLQRAVRGIITQPRCHYKARTLTNSMRIHNFSDSRANRDVTEQYTDTNFLPPSCGTRAKF